MTKPWETTWYILELLNILKIRFSSRAGTKSYWTINWNFLSCFVGNFAPTGDRWFHPQSYVSNLVSCCCSYLSSRKRKRKHFDRPEKKAICERELDNFLKKNTNDLNFLLFIAQRAEDRSFTHCDELEKNLRKAQKKSGSIVGDLAT